MKFNRSFLLAVLIFSSLILPLSAQENDGSKTIINWISPEKQELSAQWAVIFPSRRDLRNPAPSGEFITAADLGELRVDSGIKFQAEQLDFTERVFYMPTFFNTFQAGFGFNYHFYRYFKTFTENDFIISTRFRWVRGPVFSFEIAPGLLFKFASIDAIREFKPIIFNFSYHFSLICNWFLFNRANFWCGLNLQDYFDYPLAISPFYKFGFDFAANKNIIMGIDYTLKFVDMFYSAVYLNESLLRLSFKVVI